MLPGLIALQFWGGPQAISRPWLVTEVSLLFTLCLAGEFIERCLFFMAVQPVKMPGAIVS